MTTQEGDTVKAGSTGTAARGARRSLPRRRRWRIPSPIPLLEFVTVIEAIEPRLRVGQSRLPLEALLQRHHASPGELSMMARPTGLPRRGNR